MASNLDSLLSFLQGKGLTPAQAAGVAGNLQVESGVGLDPTAYNPKENAHGIAQWEGGRWTNLQTWAKQQGKSPTDLTVQESYLWAELQGPESGAYRALMAATTPTQAATVFDQQYERSAASSLPARVNAANNIANNTGSGAHGVSWTDALTNPLGVIGDAVGGAVTGWQTDALGLGLKIAAALVAGSLVIVGAREALHDKDGT